jgi:hypothetical protein
MANMVKSYFQLSTFLCRCKGNKLLIDYFLFYVLLKNISLCGDVTITGEGLQNLGRCLALRAFQQGEIFIVPYLL